MKFPKGEAAPNPLCEVELLAAARDRRAEFLERAREYGLCLLKTGLAAANLTGGLVEPVLYQVRALVGALVATHVRESDVATHSSRERAKSSDEIQIKMN